jgi:translation initiation factor 1A
MVTWPTDKKKRQFFAKSVFSETMTDNKSAKPVVGPKARGQGGKGKKRAKNKPSEARGQGPVAEDNQIYGEVTKLLGSNHMEVKCYDGRDRRCLVRGKMRGRQYVNLGDVVLVGLRDFDKSGAADIIHKYTAQEARELQRANGRAVQTSPDGDDDVAFDFAEI